MAAGADRFPPPAFRTEAEVRRMADGLADRDRTPPRPDCTHQAELAATGRQSRDSHGQQESITQDWAIAARSLRAAHTEGSLRLRVHRFITLGVGRRDAPLRHDSKAHLFSVEARSKLVEPGRMRFGWDDAAPAPIE